MHINSFHLKIPPEECFVAACAAPATQRCSVFIMAANSNSSFIRVRLHFDYAPPAVIGCRMCWLLVDLNSCRVVADLESTIREKFEFGRGSILNLFIEECYLPHTESILVVRDNDSVRVKVDIVSNATKHCSPEASSENSRKRQRPAEENGSGEKGLSLEWKKKKRKKNIEESPKLNGLQTVVVERNKKSQKKHKEKKKKKSRDEEKEKRALPSPPKPNPSVKKMPKSVERVVKSTKKHQVSRQNTSSSDSSSSSEDREPVKKAPTPKPVTKTTTPTASKTLTNGPPSTKQQPLPTTSSSDTDSSSEEENTAAKTTKAMSTKTSGNSETQQELSTANCVLTENAVTTTNESVSDEEIQLVIKKPMQQPQGRIVVGQPSWQLGRGRGQSRQAPREWSKGRGRGQSVEYSYNEDQQQQPAYSSDSLTNVSVVIQNGEESAPKADYSSMPLLAGPPQVGQKIAFKLLELTENYTPEVSEYKEAKIVSFDPASKQIELELLTASQAPVEPGKFDLVYQNADGSEVVEYAVDRSSWVTERWDSLLEPRLII